MYIVVCSMCIYIHTLHRTHYRSAEAMDMRVDSMGLFRCNNEMARVCGWVSVRQADGVSVSGPETAVCITHTKCYNRWINDAI